jgi:hypothetical protein
MNLPERLSGGMREEARQRVRDVSSVQVLWFLG